MTKASYLWQGPDREQKPVFLDRRARDDEQHHPGDRRADRGDRLADEIGQIARQVADAHALTDMDRAVEDALRRRTQPVKAVHDRRWRNPLGRALEDADGTQDVRDA